MSDTTTKRMISSYTQAAAPTLFLSSFFRSPRENFHDSEEIEIDIESPTGAKETKSKKDDDAEDNLAIITNHCPTTAGLYKLNAKLVNGKGEIAVQVFSK